MIDTDKYEGHTEGKREIQHNAFIHIEERGLYATIAGGFTTADVELIADAPLLLAEVIRLRKELKEAKDVIQYALEMSNDDDSTRVFEDYLEVIE
jgi:hypothetical protein